MYSSIRSFIYKNDRISSGLDYLVIETPLEIIINNNSSILIMFTPGMTEELVTGFLYTEGLIEKASDIKECSISTSNSEEGEEVIQARFTIKSSGPALPGIKEKRTSYSSCGICGKKSYNDIKMGFKRVVSKLRFSMKILDLFPEMMKGLQPIYQKTGGAHAAVLCDSKGNALLYSEDMGRHNALDKVIGASLIKNISCYDKILLSSGRASLEMIIKTARAGIPVFIAMSRPTSKAVEAAKYYNITLIDMAKDSNRIYTHARRIKEF